MNENIKNTYHTVVITVNAICSLSKEQKELIDKFGTSKEQISSLDGVYGIIQIVQWFYPQKYKMSKDIL